MLDDDDRDDHVMDWAGGGGWQDNDPPPPSPPRAPSPPPPAPPPPAPKPKMGRYVARCRRGLVAGRFLPLHLGHQHLVDVAARSSAELDVVVFGSHSDLVPPAVRVAWLRETFPDAKVHATVATDDFAASIRNATNRVDYDVFYGGEIAAGLAAARSLGATFVPVDPDREAFPISGSQIREDPMKHFADIGPAARSWCVRRIAVIGPESTGKTEMCKRLSQIYGTRFVPEAARALAAARGGAIDREAIQLWMRTQIASEEAVARHANRVLFADTHPETVTLWSKRLFDDVQSGTPAELRDYDLVILCNDDVPFIGRPERDDRLARHRLFLDLAAHSEHARRVVITGASWEKRLLDARKAVDQLLYEKDLLSLRARRVIAAKAFG